MSSKSSDSESLPGSRIPLRALLPVLAVIGLTSLGGGRFAYYHDALVEKRQWLADQEFLEGLVVSQIIPVPTFANFTVFIGQRLGGWVGALLGLTFILTPGAVGMLVLSYLYTLGTTQVPLVNAAFRGFGAAASGLTVVMLLRLLRMRSGIPNRSALALAALTFIALGPLQLSMLVVVPPLALVGLWLNRPGVGRSA